MNPSLSKVLCAAAVLDLLVSSGCGGGGGGDGGGGPPQVASVAITSPATPPTFATLGRTAQFAAVAKDAGDATISGATITWSSSNTSVATVSSGGLVTAVANGTTSITASSGGHTSTGVTVTVSQVAASVTITPSNVAFGAIGSTRQLSAAVSDSGGAAVAGAPAVTWSRAGNGATASVSTSGLVTAVGVGATDSAVATASGQSSKAPISVTQVVASVTVSSTGSDTLKTTGSTKTYSAVAKDSNSNTIGSATFAWASSSAAVATIGSSSGIATAVSDGSTNITASSGGMTSSVKVLVVRRLAKTLTVSPTSASITTSGGTQVFNGTAQDSAGTNLTITWTSRNTAVITVSPGSGTSTTAMAVGNGSTFVIIAGGTRNDSASISTSNQVTVPGTASVDVKDDFFQSVRNVSNPAVDTVAAGGTVTWTWRGLAAHTVTSGDSPAKFTSSALQTTGTFSVTFASTGTYGYYCTIHGLPGSGMFGTVVVR